MANRDLYHVPTIELSDPELEIEHLRFVTIYSSSLGGRGDISVFVPAVDRYATGIPIVLLLHGVHGSHWAWFLKGAAHRTALQLVDAGLTRPMMIVAPSDGLWGDGTAYMRQEEGRDYEGWICKDVLDAMRKIVPQVNSKSPIFIAGLSMGGFGALRIGAKYASTFCGIGAHSAITHIEEMHRFIHHDFPLANSKEHDILSWMEQNREILPPIRFDCGKQDSLIDANRRFHDELQRHNIPHEYCEHDGDHSWEYWKLHIRETFLFFESVLRSSSDS